MGRQILAICCISTRIITSSLKQAMESRLLSHLYVLIPVLDNDKHYWVSDSEIDKLLRHGEEWVAEHPLKELIVNRYMKGQLSLSNRAKASLTVEQRVMIKRMW